MKEHPVVVPIGFKLSKLDQSRLQLAAVLAGTTKSELAREAVNAKVDATLRKAASELISDSNQQLTSVNTEKAG